MSRDEPVRQKGFFDSLSVIVEKKAPKQESLLQSPSKMKTVKTIEKGIADLLGFAYFKF
jgi:hypothetical protein